MGCERTSVFNPNLLAISQSIRLSSAPESIKTSNSMTVVLRVTLMEVNYGEQTLKLWIGPSCELP